MIKLYKRMPSGKVRYHEAWTRGSKVVEHWGELGKRGQVKEHKRAAGSREKAALERVLAAARARGFKELEDLRTLIIEYRLDSWGKSSDLGRRAEIEDRMNELLGWTGLGHCDGGSIGSGSMEVCCLVVDFALARDVIERDLRGSPFADYSRIYDEDA